MNCLLLKISKDKQQDWTKGNIARIWEMSMDL